ncbi:MULTISPECIES: RNA polymerase sigma factor [unclassified Azospirillum]|uniref:RNA polymerase sigma factor n=1 Tax=unclassified Azospirillum TaxID=2630922 RepID=UPI001FCD8619|nr:MULTISPECIES: RNA polymerase sigma factor [unclassified Azospirillum]
MTMPATARARPLPPPPDPTDKGSAGAMTAAGMDQASNQRGMMESGDEREAMGDEALVALVAAGDRRAYGILVTRHLDRTITIAQRVLNNRAEAEDVAQEAFLRLWRHADRFDPGAARFSTWFYRITTNLCLDRTRRQQPLALEAAGDPPDPTADAETALVGQRTRNAVLAAVAELPDRLRAAVTLTYDAGLSNAEAARSMDISVKAFESLLVRARRSLRDRLAAWGAADGKGGPARAGTER